MKRLSWEVQPQRNPWEKGLGIKSASLGQLENLLWPSHLLRVFAPKCMEVVVIGGNRHRGISF